MRIVLRDSEDAKKLGKEGISFQDAKALIREFEEFNPLHILPADRAKQYLDENWEGRVLDYQHFGFKPRPKKRPFRKEKKGLPKEKQ